MPHVVVEYSANLESALDVLQLVADVHKTIVASGVFEIGAVRTRAARRDVFLVADGNPDNGFVHVTLRMAEGRDVATRKRIAQDVLDTVAGLTKVVFGRVGLGLSVEVNEIDRTTSVRLNNLHDRMEAKGLTG
jgi:5-carboxymethyl-2-hydroxymuconate isomerase